MTTEKPRFNLNLKYSSIGRHEKFKTKEEAQKRQEEVREVMARIKNEIDEAKRHAWITKDYSKDEWLLSAERAHSEYQIQHQELGRIIGEFSNIERSGIAVEDAADFDVIDYVKIHGRIGVEQNFPLDVLECEALQYQVLRDMASIRDQLKRAVIKGKQGKGYSNAHWFTSANTALKIKQATHQALMGHTAALRRDLKQKDNESFPRNFMTAAREQLSKEVYGQLMDRAHELVAEQKKKASSGAGPRTEPDFDRKT